MFGPRPVLRVFIAYSHQDLECARELYNAITSHFDKDRCKVWIDEEELLAGHKWGSRIEAAIGSSDIVLVCLSRKMLASRGYVHREVELALDVQKEIPDNRIYIIPVRLDDCDVPASLSKFHWANWFEDFGKRLILRTLEHTLEDKPPPFRVRVESRRNALVGIAARPQRKEARLNHGWRQVRWNPASSLIRLVRQGWPTNHKWVYRLYQRGRLEFAAENEVEAH